MQASELMVCMIKPELSRLTQVRQQLATLLRIIQLNDEDIHAFLLGASEWITNVIKHSKPSPQRITVAIKLKDHDDVSVLIKDDGGVFVNFEQQLEISNNENSAELAETGMGLFVIKHLFPNCDYQTKSTLRDNIWNCFTLNKSIRSSIAIIEDDNVLRHILVEYLKPLYVVKDFSSCHEFLEFIKTHSVDLVISDINLPDMNGLQLRQQLRANTMTQLVPFICLTASDNTEVEDLAGKLGIDDYLHKPINKDQLQRVVKRVLTRKQVDISNMGNMLTAAVTAKLRPSLPSQLGSYSCIVKTRNASSGGGDFLVHLTLNDEHIIFLGDVMGHGIAAKFFAHSYAGYIQGLIQSMEKSLNANHIMQKLSELIYQDPYLESIIVTCIALVLKATGEIELVNAGHPHPLLLSANSMEPITINGPLPGIELSPQYSSYNTRLKQRLMLYTDGLIESHSDPAKREQQQQQLRQAMLASNTLPLNTAAESIINQFDKITQGMPLDDTTLVLLEFAPAKS